MDPSKFNEELDTKAVHHNIEDAKAKVENHFEKCDNHHFKEFQKGEIAHDKSEGVWEKTKEAVIDAKDKIVEGAHHAYNKTKEFITGEHPVDKKI